MNQYKIVNLIVRKELTIAKRKKEKERIENVENTAGCKETACSFAPKVATCI
jgi:hypothetical protein